MKNPRNKKSLSMYFYYIIKTKVLNSSHSLNSTNSHSLTIETKNPNTTSKTKPNTNLNTFTKQISHFFSCVSPNFHEMTKHHKNSTPNTPNNNNFMKSQVLINNLQQKNLSLSSYVVLN